MYQDLGRLDQPAERDGQARPPELDELENVGHGRNWSEFFGSLTENELGGVALLRVIECTNGCIQHAFRGKKPEALSVDQTREAMGLSMGIMKNLSEEAKDPMSFQIGGREYSFSPGTEAGLREIRALYVKAFKRQEEGAFDEFMTASVACASALGNERIDWGASVVKEHLSDVFPKRTVDWGVSYLKGLLS